MAVFELFVDAIMLTKLSLDAWGEEKQRWNSSIEAILRF